MPKIVVCTTDTSAWNSLNRGGGFVRSSRLERVDRLEDAVARVHSSQPVQAVVVDDRFLPILDDVEHALRRFSPLFEQAVFLTMNEALTARWIGLLDEGFAPQALQGWTAGIRAAIPPAAPWQ